MNPPIIQIANDHLYLSLRTELPAHAGKVDDVDVQHSGLPEVLGQIKYLIVFFKVWCWRLWSVAHSRQVKLGLVRVAGSERDEI